MRIKLGLIGFTALMGSTIVSLYRWPRTLFWTFDGDCFVHCARQLHAYGNAPLDQSVISPLEGLGAAITPYGVWLHPALLPFCFEHLLTDARAVSYMVAIALAAVATYLLGRAVQLPNSLSVVAAQIMAVVFFPPVASFYFEQLSLGQLYAMGGHVSVPMSFATLFVVGLTAVGVGPRWRSITALILLPLLVVYSLLCAPFWSVILFAPISVLCVGLLAAGPTWKASGWRLLCLISCLLLLVLLGFPQFYQAISGAAAREVFPNELAGQVQQFDNFTAAIFQNAVWSIIMSGVACCCFISAVLGNRLQRCFAISVLLGSGILVIFSLAYVYGGFRWNRPVPNYFEHAMLPAYIVAAFLGLWLGWERLQKRLNLVPQKRFVVNLVIVLLVPVTSFIASFCFTDQMLVERKFLEEAEPIFEFLTPRIAIQPGEPYRGSLTVVVGVPGGPLADQWGVPDYAPEGPGCPIEIVEFWNRQIPTIEQYSELITPPFYYLLSRALARPHEYQSKSVVQVTKVRPKLLGGLGVKYVMTDMLLNDPRLALRFDNTQLFGVKLHVYEIADPNIGNFSPVHVEEVSRAADALETMLSDDFDFRQDVIVFNPLESPESLVPAERSELIYERGGVRVNAVSSGTSLLALPLQFSNTLEIVDRPERSPRDLPRLMRVNLTQTGLLFSGRLNVKIADQFGLFGDIAGRFRDIEQYRQLQIMEDGSIPYPGTLQPHAFFQFGQ